MVLDEAAFGANSSVLTVEFANETLYADSFVGQLDASFFNDADVVIEEYAEEEYAEPEVQLATNAPQIVQVAAISGDDSFDMASVLGRSFQYSVFEGSYENSFVFGF